MCIRDRGPPLLALLLAAGALLTWRTGFFPVRQAPAIAQNTLLALLRGCLLYTSRCV